MNTAKMYEFALNNKNAKFKRICNGIIYWFNEKGVLTTEHYRADLVPELHEEWELIKEPVTWQEAIQAWLDGKTIKVELGYRSATYIGSRNSSFIDTTGQKLNAVELREGKWFIEP